MKIDARPQSPLAEVALSVYETVLRGVDAELLTKNRKAELPAANNAYVLGAGKASVVMARACRDLLGKRCAGGLVVTKDGHAENLGSIEVIESSHPILDQRSIDAGQRLIEFLAGLKKGDAVVFCLSGGASSLIEVPAPGVELADLQAVNRILLASGAPIEEINVIRARFSALKGGGLARAMGERESVCFVLNDVAGADPECVGSAPLRHLFTHRAYRLLAERLNASGKRWSIGRNLRSHDWSPISDQKPIELAISWPGVSPRRATPFVRHVLIGDHLTARRLAVGALEGRTVVEADLTGDATERVDALLRDLPLNGAVVATGEPTVRVQGRAKGGRCQEMALAAAIAIAGREEVAVLCGSTDGTDGTTTQAGAVVDGGSLARSGFSIDKAKAMLAKNESHRFLQRCDALIETGPTGSNVNDVLIALQGLPT